MSTVKLTLSIDERLIQKMKLAAVRERRDVSTITEQLYAAYKEGNTHVEKESKRQMVKA